MFCLVAAPVIAAQQLAAAPEPAAANDKKVPRDTQVAIQAAFDASNVRPEEVSDAEQKKGRSKSGIKRSGGGHSLRAIAYGRLTPSAGEGKSSKCDYRAQSLTRLADPLAGRFRAEFASFDEATKRPASGAAKQWLQNRRGMGGPPMSSLEKHGRAARATGYEIASKRVCGRTCIDPGATVEQNVGRALPAIESLSGQCPPYAILIADSGREECLRHPICLNPIALLDAVLRRPLRESLPAIQPTGPPSI